MARAWETAKTEVLTDLVARIDALDRYYGRRGRGDVAAELENVRRIAARHGLNPAVTVVHVLDSLLAHGERGSIIHDWLDILRDAVGCGATDAATCDTYAAACAVRLNG